MEIRNIKDTRDIPLLTCDSGNAPQHVVVANGFVGGSLAASFAERLQAEARGQLAITTYEEPYTGSGTYGESYRAELFDKVVRSIGSQVIILAHSRGMLAWDAAGEALLDDEIAEGFVGLTPIGTSALPEVSSVERAKRLTKELVPCVNSLASAKMSAKVTGRVVQRFRRPLLVLNEIRQTLQADTVESVLKTSQAIPTAMIAGTHDKLVPSIEVQQRLNINTGYHGTHTEISATHLGAFADPRHSSAIYKTIRTLEQNQ